MSAKISDYLYDLANYLPHNIEDLLAEIINLLQSALRNNTQLVLIGNGGSYSSAEHWATDLSLLGFNTKIISPGILTALANDFGYQHSFAKILGLHNELLIAFSVSGWSGNILLAGSKISQSILFTGKNYNPAAKFNIIIPIQSTEFGIVENIHLAIGHFIRKELEIWMKTVGPTSR